MNDSPRDIQPGSRSLDGKASTLAQALKLAKTVTLLVFVAFQPLRQLQAVKPFGAGEEGSGRILEVVVKNFRGALRG